MRKFSVITMQGEPAGEIELADDWFTVKKGEQALHDVVVAYQAGTRAGTASTKNKGEVSGSGKKPWRQKGTGRARAGYRQSPIWRGGGVVFGPKPHDYSRRIPKKIAHLALCRAFSEKIQADEVRVLQEVVLAEAKTKAMAALLKSLKIEGPALFIIDKMERNLVLATRNLRNVAITTPKAVHTYQLVRYPQVIITRAAMNQLQCRLQGEKEKAV